MSGQILRDGSILRKVTAIGLGLNVLGVISKFHWVSPIKSD